MTLPKSDRRQATRQFTISLMSLLLVANTLALFVLPPGTPLGPFHACLALSLSILMAAIFIRTIPLGLYTAGTIVVIAFQLWAGVVGESFFARAGLGYGQFVAPKMIALGVALLGAVPAWFGYGVIGCCAILPFLQIAFWMPPAARSHILVPEPWETLMYAIIALVVLRHRIAEARRERQLQQVMAERDALAQQARKFLAIRDLTNTPIQILELTTAMIRRFPAEAEKLSGRLDYSLRKLRELSEILASYEAKAQLSPRDLAFDPVEILRDVEKQ